MTIARVINLKPSCTAPPLHCRRSSCGLWIICILVWFSLPAHAQRSADDEFERIVHQYCVQCHGGAEGVEGDVNLRDLDAADLQRDSELVRALIGVLDTRQMPPEDQPQPSDELRAGGLSWLKRVLETAKDFDGESQRTPIRRMNRLQYNNAVVDLFQLNCVVFTLPERIARVHNDYFDPASGRMPERVTVGNRPLGKSQMIEPRLAGVAAFPQDRRAEHGYDNRADHLSLSPLLMESFLTLGRSVTNSPDFGPQRVGIWDAFFAPPPNASKEWTVERMRSIVRERLRGFLTRAFRRAVTEASLDRYVDYAVHEVETGASFTDAMKSVAAAAISSPKFLYLYERSRKPTSDQAHPSERTKLAEPVDDWTLASRMSFFLWGSLPDERLLSLAESGKLHQPDILRSQIERMLADRKLKRFCDSFPTQWLQLDRLVSSIPDPDEFPGFYFSKYRMSMHMMLEPLLLFETVLIEDRPITDLIDPDFTYRSPKLEKAYGELGNPPGKSTGGGVTVLTFYRVPVTDRRSGGIITNAAVMTMTSGPERTKPITRGAWFVTAILKDPPEPPPADVPPLPEQDAAEEMGLTLRERLSAHRERADCRGCHEQIDPFGFALENFSPVGAWRDRYPNGRAVDASGKLFGKHKFRDVVEFKDVLLAEKDRFCRALASHLLEYALARPLGPRDQFALDEITRAVADDDYRLQSLIVEIMLSKPFLMN